MAKKFKLQTIGYLFLFSFVPTWANVDSNYIIYSPEEMQKHKKICKEKMSSNPINRKDPTYQMRRALLTLSADDTDYIPKIIGAGEIFNNEPIAYQLMHNGIKIVLNCYYDTQWLTDVIYGLKGHHEPQEEKCFYEVLKYIPESAIMIELGSYWGYYSLWFASHIKNATNYLIEPDPKRLEIGKKNFELNNKTGIFRRGFVGKMKDNEPDIKGARWISMDDFIEEEGIDHVHILHADIQGAESEMLETTVKHLDHIDYFFISTHSDRNHLPCLRFFKEHQFIILAEHSDAESFSGDGLIIAKRKDVPGPDEIPIQKYRGLK
jgi:hypothetical protein